ncbi:hypothetical protein [Maribacter sp. 2307ULW6-5]|uniref:hypothetical protein n=1 Tax=Maribacter sp. 2307ULW6-5 TaxID=3386275 RepID=UPI0039BD186B
MPIKSYLAHAHTGKKDALHQALSAMEGCEVVPAENQDVLALVTDTATEEEDGRLKASIEALDSLKLLALVSGFNTPQS